MAKGRTLTAAEREEIKRMQALAPKVALIVGPTGKKRFERIYPETTEAE